MCVWVYGLPIAMLLMFVVFDLCRRDKTFTLRDRKKTISQVDCVHKFKTDAWDHKDWYENENGGIDIVVKKQSRERCEFCGLSKNIQTLEETILQSLNYQELESKYDEFMINIEKRIKAKKIREVVGNELLRPHGDS